MNFNKILFLKGTSHSGFKLTESSDLDKLIKEHDLKINSIESPDAILELKKIIAKKKEALKNEIYPAAANIRDDEWNAVLKNCNNYIEEPHYKTSALIDEMMVYMMLKIGKS